MIYDNSFTLEQMMETAQDQMTTIKKRLRSIDATLNQRLDGQNRLSLLGTVIASLGWVAAFVLVYVCLSGHLPQPYRLALLGVSLLLALFMIIDELVRIKYYGTILKARKRLSQLRRRVEKAQSNLAGHLQTYLEQQGARWELPLDAGTSINQEASKISARLSGLEALSSSFITGVKNILYYVVCAAWTAAGSYVIFGFVADSQFVEGLSSGTLTIMMAAAMVIACIFDALFARMVWAKTDCEVGNLTLLALAVGPVIFAVVIVAILIIYVVILVVLYIVATIFGIGAAVFPFQFQ